MESLLSVKGLLFSASSVDLPRIAEGGLTRLLSFQMAEKAIVRRPTLPPWRRSAEISSDSHGLFHAHESVEFCLRAMSGGHMSPDPRSLK